jgi:hypothetical protein
MNVAGLVVTTGGPPFCADALVQIRISAPKHAALLNNCLATPMADFNLISVSFVFIVAPLFVFPFTAVVRKTRREVTRKVWIFFTNRADPPVLGII